MKSKKAPATSARTVEAEQSVARKITRQQAVSESALPTRAKRQFQKTRAKGIQAHVRASGRRRQARRDAR